MGWTNPAVFGSLAGGVLLLGAFVVIESRVAEPMFALGLFRIRAFAAVGRHLPLAADRLFLDLGPGVGLPV